MTQTLARYASGQLRSELARRLMPNSQLAALLGVSEMWVTRRVRNHVELSLEDIESLAQVLDVPTSYFTERPAQVSA